MTHKHTMFEQIVNQIVEEIQALPNRKRLGEALLPKLTASVAKLIRDSAGLHLTKAKNQKLPSIKVQVTIQLIGTIKSTLTEST